MPLFAADGPRVDCIEQASVAEAAAQSPIRRITPLKLEGTVLGVDARHRAFALQDDSGVVWLEGVPWSEPLESGMRVAIEGRAALGYGHALLEVSPVVEQHRNLGSVECQGIIHLTAGKHPFELDFRQLEGSAESSVRCQGAGWASNTIPASALFHADPALPGTFVPGLRYEVYEGTGSEIPDFQKLAPSRSGTTTTFALAAYAPTNNFTVRFFGFIEMPVEGDYEFTVAADDGAQLSVGYATDFHLCPLGEGVLPEARAIQARQAWDSSERPFWGETEGTVSYLGQQGGQLQLQLRSDRGGRMQVIVSDCTAAAPEILMNSQVRVRGLCRSLLTPGGERIAGELFAPSMNEITVIEAPESLWLKTPLSSIDQLPIYWAKDRHPRLVHLKGTVVEVEAGRSLLLDDSSSRMRVQDNTAASSDRGAAIEVLGQLAQMEERLALSGAVHRVVTNAAGVALPTLTSIEQVRRLKPNDAARKYPVRFRGVITFVFSGAKRAHIQGDNEGIYIAGTSSSRQMLQVGDVCLVEGYTGPGAFSPIVTYRKVTVLGKGQLPEPLRPVREQLMNGSLDAQWVEVRGVALTVEDDGDLLLGTREGNVAARVFSDERASLTNYIGDIVRVRGTVRPFANRQRQVRSVLLQVPSKLQITVDEPAPSDPFNMPLREGAALSQFDANAAGIQRVKVAGQLLCVRHGIGYMTDGTNGIRFQLRAEAPAELAAGDCVEVVGFPKLDGPFPLIQDALVRKVGSAPLPEPRQIGEESLLARENDANRVQLKGTLLTITTNHTDQVLEVQRGARTYLARLDHKYGVGPMVPCGSHVQLTGVFVGEGIRDSLVTYLQTFELLLNSPEDIVVLDQPSWWTLSHSMAVVGGLILVLGMAAVWIAALRRQVGVQTRELREEIEERKRMQQEVEHIHRQLVDASRRAGQAEVASSVLHNVGNVLNSVNVSTSVIADCLQRLQVANVGKAAGLLQERKSDLGYFLTEDDRGRRIPGYLNALGTQLVADQTELLEEVKDLARNVEHMKEIVAMQQAYTKVAGVTETLALPELVENAVKMHSGAYARHGICLEREFEDVPLVTVDKHKVLQILVNILHNAKYACDAGSCEDKRVVLRIAHAAHDRVRVEVVDNGMGITQENLSKLFTHGFTTRRNGNGFGLHSAALAARELGGTLTARSEGVNKGATFTLEIPIQLEVSEVEFLHAIGASEGFRAMS